MKQKYYDRADGKLYKCVFCDSRRTEMPERLTVYVVRRQDYCRTGV